MLRIEVLLPVSGILFSLCSCTGSGVALRSSLPAWTGEVRSGENSRAFPVTSTAGMVVADDEVAAGWGAEILRRGGNAVDAAVATAFALSVTRPHYAALGAGGFLLYCPAPKGGEIPGCSALDFRETAPKAAYRELFVRDGKARTELSKNGALASGVPGLTAGLLTALEKFGSLPRAGLLAKPLILAREGVRVSTNLERAASERWPHFNAEARRIFGCGRSEGPCPVGAILKQPELSRTLERIAKEGRAGFYAGFTAAKLVETLREAGGILTREDLSGFEPKFRTPLTGKFSEFEIVTMPPPSSGGVALVQLLALMKRAQAQRALPEFGSAASLHAEAHALSLVFADRARHLGDPDFRPVPLGKLLSEEYLDTRWRTFREGRASVSQEAGRFDSEEPREPQHTTHLSVIDRSGNAVAVTVTVNDNFGSGFVPPGTGVVMNNEMDDFSLQPGVANLFGLVGGEANSVQAGKRPLSSMTPTIVRDSEGRNRLVLGAAGGPRIISSVFQVLLNRLEFGMSLPDAVAAPRIHQQWKPETLRLERFGISAETRAKLRDMGYRLEEVARLGTVHALERFTNGRVWGAPDPRGEGVAVGE